MIDILDLLTLGKSSDDLLSRNMIEFYVPRERETDDQQLTLDFSDNFNFENLVPDFQDNADFSDKLMTTASDTDISQIIIEDSDQTLSAEVPSTSSSLSPSSSSFDDGNVFTFDHLPYSDHQRTFSECTDADSVYSTLGTLVSFSPTSPYSEPPATPDSTCTSASGRSRCPVKESLKMMVQSKRKKEGKGELKVEFEPPKPEQLTEEELELRRIKREKNKLAAQKCRSKKRERTDVLEAETRRLQAQQDKSVSEIQRLVEERDRLMDIINVHGSVCPTMMLTLANM